MKTLPRFTYNGLTVVLSNPSRNDKIKLLDGWAGSLFANEALDGLNINGCMICTADEPKDLLAGTKGLLLLGERAMKEWTTDGYDQYSLNEQRGCPLQNKWNIPCIASYLPQDCVDMKDWESVHNPLAKEEHNEKEDETEKRKGKTARSNYRFWLIQDTKKICKRIRVGSSERDIIQVSTIIYPSSEEIIKTLREVKNEEIYLDIETDEHLHITCIGLGIDNVIFVIPFLRYNYESGYANLAQILQALSICFRDNIIVGHNSAAFDLLVLAGKYKVHVGHRNVDTMLAWHRMYPEVEKSLGHVMSALTWEPYHKDEFVRASSAQQERKLWEYNAKDVYGTMLIWKAMKQCATSIPGLRESIEQSNRLIRPSLITTLQGIRFDQAKREAMMTENDKLCNAYTRLIKLALGPELYKIIQNKSDANMAGSPKQCVKYFHDIMGYKVVGKTPKKEPSLAADNMYKLKLRYPDNFIIDLILAYRERAKETGSLKFNEWKGLL